METSLFDEFSNEILVRGKLIEIEVVRRQYNVLTGTLSRRPKTARGHRFKELGFSQLHLLNSEQIAQICTRIVSRLGVNISLIHYYALPVPPTGMAKDRNIPLLSEALSLY